MIICVSLALSFVAVSTHVSIIIIISNSCQLASYIRATSVVVLPYYLLVGATGVRVVVATS
jgi:hypothetical protein